MQNLSGSAAGWVTDEMKNKKPRIEKETDESKEQKKPDMRKIIKKLAESHEAVSEMYKKYADKNISDGLVSLESAIMSFKNID